MKFVLANIAALGAMFGIGVMYADQVRAWLTRVPADVRKEALIAYNAAIARAVVAKHDAVQAAIAKVGQAPEAIKAVESVVKAEAISLEAAVAAKVEGAPAAPAAAAA